MAMQRTAAVRRRVPRRRRSKVARVMREFARGILRSGSKRGPVVRSRAQAIAIALRQAGIARRRS